MSKPSLPRKTETTQVIEVVAQSKEHWKGPVLNAAEDADKPLRNIKAIWLRSLNSELANGRIKSWRLNCTISFEVEKDEEVH